MTHMLRRFGLPRASQVAVGHTDFYVQLLIVFGFDNLGIATGSFRPSEGPECHGLLAGADLTMSQHPVPPGLCRQVFAITDAWVAAALDGPAGPVFGQQTSRPTASEAALVLRSSGTTGRPKRMLVTHGMLRMRLQHWITHLGLTSRSRYFSAMHFSMGTMYHSASACLRLGATFMFDTRNPLQLALKAHQPSHLTLMPHQLGLLLDELPASGPPLVPGLALSVIGGKFSPALRQCTLERLCGEALETYGTNEAFLHSVVDAEGVGTVTWGIEMQVVDGRDQVLTQGEIGHVRLRGRGVVRGYLDDAAATADMFRHGWFYPGDLAVFVAPGRLRLIGRDDDVLNLGGYKLACADLESEIRARAALRDVALLQRDDSGSEALVVACVVTTEAADLSLVAETIRAVLKTGFTIHPVGAIPRTAEGKIRRGALRQLLATTPAVAERPASAACATLTADLRPTFPGQAVRGDVVPAR